jgi:hypothetical protein
MAEDGCALQFASAELRADRQVVLTAVAQADDALQYALEYFYDGCALQFASAELRADREVVLAAMAQHGYALEYASAELRADREVVLAAVAQNGYALEYASAELRADREVVLTAVAQAGNALWFASEELQDLVPRLRRFRPVQRLLLAATESRGADCLTAAPLVLGPHLPLSLDIRQMVQGYLEASSAVPAGGSLRFGAAFAWHEAQVLLADDTCD